MGDTVQVVPSLTTGLGVRATPDTSTLKLAAGGSQYPPTQGVVLAGPVADQSTTPVGPMCQIRFATATGWSVCAYVFKVSSTTVPSPPPVVTPPVPQPPLGQVQKVQSFPLNKYVPILDGQWEGTRYASDGNVYFGSSTHDAHHGAAFFKYDPLANHVTMLSDDITKICGEDPNTNPQGKLHSDIVESNGWLYMATYLGSQGANASVSYSGSHVIGYELASGKFRDYGVVYPNYTTYSGLGVDSTRKFIYVFVTGENAGQASYLFRIDAATGAKTNLGQVGGTYNTDFYIFVDQNGYVWFSVDSGSSMEGGVLQRYNPDTNQIERFPNELPLLHDAMTGALNSDQSSRHIHWMQPLDGTHAVFTMGYYDGKLYELDATKAPGNGDEFSLITDIGYTDLGLALAPISKKVFYYQRANRGCGYQGDGQPQGYCGNPATSQFHDFHLLSVSLDPGTGHAITDYGLLQDQDGRVVWRVPSMMTDGDSKIFMTGDWWTIPSDITNGYETLRYTLTNGVESYLQIPRGEFFAVTDVPNAGGGSLPLSISTSSLPQGSVGVTYGANMTAAGGTRPYTWLASGPAAGLSIGSTGLLSGIPSQAGTFSETVTVTDSTGATATAVLSVKINTPVSSPPTILPGSGAALVSLTVTPSALTAPIGGTQQFTATGFFSDGTTQDLTSSVIWNSSSPAVAVITSGGLATVQGPGATTISAQMTGGATIVGQSQASVPTPSGLPNGLALHWALNTTAITDISGNGANGVANGNLAVVTGKFGQALRFNGTDAYVTAPGVSSVSFSHSLSLSAWINTTNGSRTEAIFSKYEAAGREAGYIFGTDQNGHLSLRIGGTNMAGGPHGATDTTKINDGQWHHVIAVVSYENQTITFYVDGKPTSTTAMQMVPNDAGATLQLGQNPYTPYGDYFTGSIDEVQIYDRALSTSEASTVYLMGGGL